MKTYLIAYQRVPGGSIIHYVGNFDSVSKVVDALKQIAPDAYPDPFILAIVEINPTVKA